MASNQPESENDEWVMVPSDIESSQDESASDDEGWVDVMAAFEKLISAERSDGTDIAQESTTTSEEPPQPPTDALMSAEEYFNVIHSLWPDISTSYGTELLDRFSYDMNIFHMFRYAWLCRYTETLPSSASSASASHPHSNSVPSIDLALRSPLHHLKMAWSFWRKFLDQLFRENQLMDFQIRAYQGIQRPPLPTLEFTESYVTSRCHNHVYDFFTPITIVRSHVYDYPGDHFGYHQFWKQRKIRRLISLVRRDITLFDERVPQGFNCDQLKLYILPRITGLLERLTALEIGQAPNMNEVGLGMFR